jgi:hypothetical protein
MMRLSPERQETQAMVAVCRTYQEKYHDQQIKTQRACPGGDDGHRDSGIRSKSRDWYRREHLWLELAAG